MEKEAYFIPLSPFASLLHCLAVDTDGSGRPDSLIPFPYSLNLSSLSGRGSGGGAAKPRPPINLHITSDRMVLITY